MRDQSFIHSRLCWILFILIAVAAFLVALAPIGSADFVLMERTGQLILEQGTIPTTDPFSFTAGENRWIEHKWLVDLIFAKAQEFAPIVGVVVLTAGMTALIFLLLGSSIFRARYSAPNGTLTTSTAILCLIIALTLLWASDRFSARAHLFGYLYLLLSLVVIQLLTRNPARLWLPICCFAIVQVLWVNSHASAILAPCLVGAYVASDWIQSKRISKPFTILLPTSMLLLLVNPSGHHLITSPLSHLFRSQQRDVILAEWVAITELPFSISTSLLFIPFSCCILLTLNHFYQTYRNKSPQGLGANLCLLFFLLLALMSVRFITPFLLVSIFLCKGSLAKLVDHRLQLRQSLVMTLHVVCILLLVGLIANESARLRADSPFTMKLRRYPGHAIDYLEENAIRGNAFHTFDQGIYLAGRMYPKIKIFVDGRLDLYDPTIFQDYSIFIADYEEFEDSSWYDSIDILFLEYEEPTGQVRRFAVEAHNSPDWEPRYRDRAIVIFTRNQN